MPGCFDSTERHSRDVWLSDESLSNHYATSVLHEGVLYGFHGRQEFGPLFRAVDLRTGKVLWSTERFGAGSVTLAGNRLVIVRESGALLFAAASPKSFQQIASAQILPATVRAYPAIADGILYMRNDDTLVAVDLALAAVVLACTVLTAQAPQSLLDRAVDEFEQGRFAASAATFDQLATLIPDAGAAALAARHRALLRRALR